MVSDRFSIKWREEKETDFALQSKRGEEEFESLDTCFVMVEEVLSME